MVAELEGLVYHRTLASVLTGCLTEGAQPTAFRPPLRDCACETLVQTFKRPSTPKLAGR